MQQQYLQRKSGTPFIFKGAAFPDAVLALTGIREFSGLSAFGHRDVTIIITAAAYASLEAMQQNIADPLRTFAFELTRNGFTSKEFTASGQIDVSVNNEAVNASMLNIEHQSIELGMFKYDLNFAGGKIFTQAGLQALLQMPSITPDRTLGDEWEIPST